MTLGYVFIPHNCRLASELSLWEEIWFFTARWWLLPPTLVRLVELLDLHVGGLSDIMLLILKLLELIVVQLPGLRCEEDILKQCELHVKLAIIILQFQILFLVNETLRDYLVKSLILIFELRDFSLKNFDWI